MSKELKQQSKFLSLVLRHRPEKIGITLDENGWVEITKLIDATKAAGQSITRGRLKEIVYDNDKQRFAISEDGKRIRASQGHSIKSIDLQLEEREPPEILFHGTVERFMDQIESVGLHKMKRHHVHLSATVETATSVGMRRGEPVILVVDAEGMYKSGFKFFRSENGVWLTDAVPKEYIRRAIA